MNNFTLSIDSDKFEKNINAYLKFSMNKLYANLAILFLSSIAFILFSDRFEVLQHIVVRILWGVIMFRMLIRILYMNSFITTVYKKKTKLINKIKNSHTSFNVNTLAKSKEHLYKSVINRLRENIQTLVLAKNNSDLTTSFTCKVDALSDSSISILSFELHRSYIRITDGRNILVVDLPVVKSKYEALQPLSILLHSIKVD
ncbi:g307 [Yersinia phage phiR1-37]|uniref:hypothetical protein n=1 Tax=Yersinia phage phiR1-37 TaxID=331278 RepID=UPI00022DBDDE|nr:hypothetical protein phiR1-37_gp307 [Yersinia phage phiR1-37]CCE26330.1 g307 [Yersinia phage phiR1-37]